MGNIAGSLGSHFTVYANVYEISIDTANNRSLVRMDSYVSCDSTATGVWDLSGPSWSGNTNGNVQGGGFAYDFRGNDNQVYLGTFDTWVYHDGSGNATIGWSISVNMANSPYLTTGSESGSFTCTHIDRYANIDGFNINDVTDEWVEFAWHADNPCDYISWWSVAYDGGGHHDIPASGQGWWTIDLHNLNSGTTYDITVAVRRADSGLWTDSGTQYPTTAIQNNFVKPRVL